MFSKGIAIVAITKCGIETAFRIKEALAKQDVPSVVYAPEKYNRRDALPLAKKFDEFIKDHYLSVDAIVGVMATGIIIRAVAPLLQSKLVDPAVIGVDASGSFAISLLSGHYGGANELARLIAHGIGATPVITTASDVMGRLSIDEVARIMHLKIENPKSLVEINSAIVNGSKVVLVKLDDVNFSLINVLGMDFKEASGDEEAADILKGYDAGAVITRKPISRKLFTKPTTFLKPFTIAVGLGARKVISEEAILTAVTSALEKVKVPIGRVERITTVSIKRGSKNMENAAKKLGLKLEFIDTENLNRFKHPDLSPDSEIVKRNIGVGGVCERAALIAAGEKTRLILKKTVLNGVTVAIAEGE